MSGFRGFGQDSIKSHHTASRQEHSPLDDVLQFTNVSWPRVTLERPHRAIGESQPTTAIPLCGLLEEVRR